MQCVILWEHWDCAVCHTAGTLGFGVQIPHGTQMQTFVDALSYIRTHDPSVQAAEGSTHLALCCHCDEQLQQCNLKKQCKWPDTTINLKIKTSMTEGYVLLIYGSDSLKEVFLDTSEHFHSFFDFD